MWLAEVTEKYAKVCVIYYYVTILQLIKTYHSNFIRAAFPTIHLLLLLFQAGM